MFSVFIPLETGDIIQGQKFDTKYEIIDIQHTYSYKENNVIDISLLLRNIVTGIESKLSYDYDTWKIVK